MLFRVLPRERAEAEEMIDTSMSMLHGRCDVVPSFLARREKRRIAASACMMCFNATTSSPTRPVEPTLANTRPSPSAPFAIIQYYSKPKGEPVNEERNNWPVPETLLGQNDRTLSSELSSNITAYNSPPVR